MFLWILIGIVIGYLFKSQIDILVGKIIKKIKHKDDDKWDSDY